MMVALIQSRPAHRPARERGFALIAVLWLVAALSILVSSLTMTVKSEMKTASYARQMLQAGALGEGAMQLALQEVVAGGKRPTKLLAAPVSYGGREIPVQVVPMSGFIDINRAPVDLLQAAFQVAGGMDAGSAGELANAIDTIRKTPGASGRPQWFESVEDLLLIPGVDYGLYSRVAPVLTTDAGGTGRVNAMAAPAAVLNVVSNGNAAAAASFVEARAADQPGLDTSAFNGAWIGGVAPGNVFELTAQVPLPDGGTISIVRRYMIRTTSPDGLPWRAFFGSAQVEMPALPKP